MINRFFVVDDIYSSKLFASKSILDRITAVALVFAVSGAFLLSSPNAECSVPTQNSVTTSSGTAASVPTGNGTAVSGTINPETKSNLVDRPKRELFASMNIESLDFSTRELAEQLEIYPMLQELYTAKNTTEQRKSLIRQKIQETILESYFDAESVKAEADREEMRLSILKESLISRRDRSVEVNNAGNFIISGTLNTVGAALGFPKSANPFSGNLNQLMSGVVSTGMSMYALKQSAGGGKTDSKGSPTILAELFGRPTNLRTSYPESVWRFLHGKSLDVPEKTRLQLLEEGWISRHYLEPHGSALEKTKIDAVCGRPGIKMSINDLGDQISMISEIEGVTELMAHHLRDLLRMIDSDLNI